MPGYSSSTAAASTCAVSWRISWTESTSSAFGGDDLDALAVVQRRGEVVDPPLVVGAPVVLVGPVAVDDPDRQRGTRQPGADRRPPGRRRSRRLRARARSRRGGSRAWAGMLVACGDAADTGTMNVRTSAASVCAIALGLSRDRRLRRHGEPRPADLVRQSSCPRRETSAATRDRSRSRAARRSSERPAGAREWSCEFTVRLRSRARGVQRAREAAGPRLSVPQRTAVRTRLLRCAAATVEDRRGPCAAPHSARRAEWAREWTPSGDLQSTRPAVRSVRAGPPRT